MLRIFGALSLVTVLIVSLSACGGDHDPGLQSLAITPANPYTGIGRSEPLRAIGTYSDGSTADLTADVSWASDNTSTATVNPMGSVTGVALGAVTITASGGGKTGTTTFTITDNPWSTAGSLPVGLHSHTATRLLNGKVLVTGGFNNSVINNVLNSCHLYDPATGTWSETGSLKERRFAHTATLLQDGMVLVAAGFGAGDYTNTAELYDPATGTWSDTGSMTQRRGYHTATLLPSGKVLLAGGNVGVGYFADCELYDPAAGIWSSPAGIDLANARSYHTTTLLSNGTVLAAGGFGGSFLNSSELYDEATGTWSVKGPLGTAHMEHSAALLSSGKVLLAAGKITGSNLTASAELYDPALGTWSGTGDLATPRASHTATTLLTGSVLVVGGYSITMGYVGIAGCELYDPTGGAWSAAGNLSTGRYWHTATLLTNGKVLVVGGSPNGTASLSSAELSWVW